MSDWSEISVIGAEVTGSAADSEGLPILDPSPSIHGIDARRVPLRGPERPQDGLGEGEVGIALPSPGFCHNCLERPVSVVRSDSLCPSCLDELEGTQAEQRRFEALQTNYPKFLEEVAETKSKLAHSWGVKKGEGLPGRSLALDLETCYLSGFPTPSFLVAVVSVGSDKPEDAFAGRNLKLREDWVALSADEQGNNLRLIEKLQSEGGFWVAPHAPRKKPSFVVVSLNLQGRKRI